ncbi:unnamed protein product [Boreogadus saida]
MTDEDGRRGLVVDGRWLISDPLKGFSIDSTITERHGVSSQGSRYRADYPPPSPPVLRERPFGERFPNAHNSSTNKPEEGEEDEEDEENDDSWLTWHNGRTAESIILCTASHLRPACTQLARCPPSSLVSPKTQEKELGHPPTKQIRLPELVGRGEL